MDDKKIGKFIQELRKEYNYTQEDLSKKVLVNRETVSKWERGVYIPSNEILLKLSEIFDVSINEILYGERKNQYNNEKINAVPINIIKQSNKRIRKTLFISSLIITMISLVFLLYYFFNNYNSIRVYKISGESNHIILNDGVMIVSKEKSYIQLGNIINDSDNIISDIRLFYKKKGKEYEIFHDRGDKTSYLLINDFKYTEIFDYKDLEYVKNNLFLRILFDDNKSIDLKLSLVKDFSNNNIFRRKNTDIIFEDKKNNSEIPEFIINNFIKQDDSFYLESSDKETKVIQKYIIESRLYSIDEIYSNYTNHYDFFLDEDSLIFYKTINNNMYNDFTYDIRNSNCIYGKCETKIINYFLEKYFSNF